MLPGNQPLVSIIMPAYNAEKYLKPCIESILAQSYPNFELIIIDDGSHDATLRISEAYQKGDERITVIHQSNKGVSAARNAGLDRAKGEYIAFVDADDIIPVDSISVRVNLIHDADMALAGYVLTDECLVETGKMPICRDACWDRHEAVKNILLTGEYGYQGYSVNKLFRRELIIEHHIRFMEDIVTNEDRLFCVTYAMKCQNVRLSNENVYYYRQMAQSTMGSIKKLKDRDYKRFVSEFEAFDQMLDIVKAQYLDCYYLGAVEAQSRAWVLKREVSNAEKRLNRELNRRIWKYGRIALGAPQKVISYLKKIKIILHMILLR